MTGDVTRATRRAVRRAPAAPRHGFVLALTLGAIVLVGALAAGLMFAAGQERRAARQILAGERALAAAELAVSRAPAVVRAAPPASLPVGRALAFVVALDRGDSAVVRITRATRQTAWVVADAEVGTGADRARRAVTMLFTLIEGPAESVTLGAVTKRAWNQKL